jgi:hypothetical protein
MSWQAMAWAIQQRVRPPARKLLLVALANYADKDGVCWPSQARLAYDTEMSLDTIQRQTKKLVADGLMRVERPPKRRGQWQTFLYLLAMTAGRQAAECGPARQDTAGGEVSPSHGTGSGEVSPSCEIGSADHDAARPGRTQPDTRPQVQTAPSPTPGRTAMRSNPSREQSIKQSAEQPAEQPAAPATRANTKRSALERRQAWQWNGAVEVIQDRIARRLGNGDSQKGWLIVLELDPNNLDFLTSLDALARLTTRLCKKPC